MIVYRHIRLDKNEPFYIGIGNDEDRAYRKDGRNPLWSNIVQKTEYKVQILFEGLTREEACEKEIELISLYGRINKGDGILANITSGGDILMAGENPAYNRGVEIIVDGVVYPSVMTASRQLGLHEKTIRHRIKSENFPNYNYTDPSKVVKKLSYKEIEDNKRLKNGMLGKRHSKESIKKMSEKLTGKKVSAERKFLSKFNKPNRVEVWVDDVRFVSIAHAADFIGCAQNSISKAIKKNRGKVMGHVVSFADGIEYTQEILIEYMNKYPDKADVYPHPALINMLKKL